MVLKYDREEEEGRHVEHLGRDFSRASRVWTEHEAGMAMGLPHGGVVLEDYRGYTVMMMSRHPWQQAAHALVRERERA